MMSKLRHTVRRDKYELDNNYYKKTNLSDDVAIGRLK